MYLETCELNSNRCKSYIFNCCSLLLGCVCVGGRGVWLSLAPVLLKSVYLWARAHTEALVYTPPTKHI